MRRLLLSFTVIVFAIVSLAAFAQEKSLGDVARESRNTPKKSSTRVFTDENFTKPESKDTAAKPKAAGPEQDQDVVEGDEDATVDADGDAVPPKPKAKAKPEAGQKAEAAADKGNEKQQASASSAELAKEWKSQIANQRGIVDLIEREISVMEREHKLRASSYYADAGLRLRDDRRWQDDEKKYDVELEAKKQKLAKAKDSLDQLIEQARRAGVNGID